MQIKLSKAPGKTETYDGFSHVQVTKFLPGNPIVEVGLAEFDDDGAPTGVMVKYPPGIEVEMIGGKYPKGHTLRIPEDGDAIYIINDAGRTTETYRWPPPARSEGGK